MTIASDGVAGKPELCDYGWMGVRQRLMRAETLFRGSHKPLRIPVACTPRGEQVCRPAPAAERRYGSSRGCAAGLLWTLAGRWPRLGRLLGTDAGPASSAFPELGRRVADSRFSFASVQRGPGVAI